MRIVRLLRYVDMLFILSLLGLPLPSKSFGEYDHDASHKCTDRWDLSKTNEHDASKVNCSTLKASNPICSEDIDISYENLPPYVYWNEDEQKVDGILVSKYRLFTRSV